MLETLSIRNFAIITDLTVQFSKGFNVLSGETGAGKSIIIQALALLLGGRGFSDLIRKGEKEAEVTGVFKQTRGNFTIRRLLSVEGKNKIFVNGDAVSLMALQELGQELMDLATQHENQLLLQSEKHREILDLFGGLRKEKEAYEACFRRTQELALQKKKFIQKIEETRKEEDYLQYQLQEIRQANLKEGEEEELLRERELTKHAVLLGEILARAETALDSGDENITGRLSMVLKELEKGGRIDSRLGETAKGLETALSLIQDAVRDLKGYDLSSDPGRLQEVEDRLGLIRGLKKKYGDIVSQIIQKEKELQEDLNRLDNFDKVLQELDLQLKQSEQTLKKNAAVLRKKRKEAAAWLSTRTEKELATLGMGKIQFVASVEPLTEGALQIEESFYDLHGGESVEFLMAPNLGEGIRPMVRIASGGELARILLALKTILGESRRVENYVFDEVDVGIGGAAAEAVGLSLKKLSQKAQVITITHLPQIASLADHHLAIRKEVQKGRTVTAVTPLKPQEREDEIARMLGGFKISDSIRAHARELLK
ncbi:MAG: DNA repair protein RecN [bacterium]|nr:DNA repair protein RecN [bacterium]